MLYGDENLSVQTVEKYLDIDISYYAKVNMEGLSDLVDVVGGVTVTNDIDWTYGGYHYKKGELNLDGKHALAYARMRHQDSRGDFGRNLRQRQVIQSILQEGKSFTSVTKIDNVLDVLGGNVTTNLSFDDMKRLASDYRSCQQTITNYENKGSTARINGISWVLVTQEEFDHIHDKIVAQLAGELQRLVFSYRSFFGFLCQIVTKIRLSDRIIVILSIRVIYRKLLSELLILFRCINKY